MSPRRSRRAALVGVLFLCAACAGQDDADTLETTAGEPLPPAAEVTTDPSVALGCVMQREDMDRVSPYDSTTIDVGLDLAGKVCYSRPNKNERTIFGDLTPYGELWRTGANEPTTLHLPFEASIAGVAVEPGHYSLYTIPMEDEPWTIILNRAVDQWGHESTYTAEVEAQEVGRGHVQAEVTDGPVEAFTIRWERADDLSGHLVLEWETTRVRIPVQAGS